MWPDVCGRFRLNGGWRLGRRSAASERRISRQRGQEVLARRLEFGPDESQVEQEDAEVVAGASGIEAALAAGGGASVERLGGHGQNQLDVGLDLAGVERGFEPAELDRAPVPDVVQVHPVVAGTVEVLRAAVVIAVPDAVELVRGPRPPALDVPDQLVAHRPGVGPLPVLADAERREDQWLLFVDDLGQVPEGAPVEGTRVHVDVDAAMPVDLGAALADRPDDLLEGRDVGVGQDRGDDLGPEMARDVAERAVGYDLPGAPLLVDDLPGVEDARPPRMSDVAAHHRLDGLGHAFACSPDRLDLDPEA